MTEPEHLPWRVVPADGGEHIFASFNNQDAARTAALQMNWTPDRDRVLVVYIEPKEPNQ